MWDCSHCGCKNIAPSVPFCPMCFVPRDVAAGPGQPVEVSDSSPVGSKQEEISSPPSGDDSAEAPPPHPPTSENENLDWGKD